MRRIPQRRTLTSVALAGLLVGSGITVVTLGTGGPSSVGHHDHEQGGPPIAGAEEVAVTAKAMRFEPRELQLDAGQPVNVTLSSSDGLHDLTVDEIGFHLAAERGTTATAGLRFEDPGTYVAYCTLPGHREAGMELDITVR